MHVLLIDLYELSQFLRILAWIFFPLLLVTLLITAWLHRRKKKKTLSADAPSYGLTGEDPPSKETPQEGDSPYKGLLWMKYKYEQYREETDLRIERIKEELAAAEKKYLDLLASRPIVSPASVPATSTSTPAPDPGTPLSPRDQRINNYHELECQALQQQAMINTLTIQNTALSAQNTDLSAQITDLSEKLDNNIRLLTNFHKELNHSLSTASNIASHETNHVTVPAFSE